MNTVYTFWAIYTLALVSLLVLLERMMTHANRAWARRERVADGLGLIAPLGYRVGKPVLIAVRVALALSIVGAVVIGLVVIVQGGPARATLTSTNSGLTKRNELLARAEKMARFGNKGLMRANITHARKCGPVSPEMVARVESFLVAR